MPEVEATPAATEIPGSEAPVQLSEAGAQVAQIIERARTDADFAAMPEVAAILEKVKGLKPAATTPPPPAPIPGASDDPGQLSEEGKAVAQILELAAKDPAYAAQPEVKAIVDAAKAQAEAKAKQSAEEEEGTDDDPDEDDPEGSEEEGIDPADGKKKNKNSFFFAEKITKVPELKTPEEHQKYIKEKFGVTDPAQLYQAAEGWRKDAQQFKEASDKNSGYQKIFDEMPDAIYNALQAWGRGEDWTQPIQKGMPIFNFTKSFDDQKQLVVNHYFPGKYTPQEINDNTDPVVQGAIDVAKEKFNLEKNKVDSQRALTLEEADKRAKALKTSVDSSIDLVKQSFPEASQRRLSDIRQMLLSGDVNRLFFKDGVAIPEAAERIALALYGKQEITGKVNSEKRKAASKATNKALMDMINRGKTTVETPKVEQSRPQIPAEVSDAMRGLNKKTYY